jgi:hypothetical protein
VKITEFNIKVFFALLIFPFMAYEGLERGELYGSIDEGDSLTMQIDSIVNNNSRTFFPDYRANGILLPSKEPLSVDIFKREYRQLESGDHIEVFAVPAEPNEYVTASKLEESKPFIPLGILDVTWHFPVAVAGGFFMVIYIVLFLLNAKNESST